MLLDRLLPDAEDWALTIVATDVDADALAAATAGVYGDWALRELPAWARRAFPHRGAPAPRAVRADPPRWWRFAPLNLATDPYPGALDVIVCRNVLMYFTTGVRHAAVASLGRALVPGGWLLLSPLDAAPGDEAPLLAPVEAHGTRVLRRAATIPAAGDAEPPAPAARPAAVEPEPVLARASLAAATAALAATTAAAPLGTAAPAARASRPTAPLPPLTRARAEADQGRAEAALVLCREALRDDPLDAEAHLLTAAVEEERGDARRRRRRPSPRDLHRARRAHGARPARPLLLRRRGDDGGARRSLATAAALLEDQAPGTPVPGGGGHTAASLLAQLEVTS